MKINMMKVTKSFVTKINEKFKYLSSKKYSSWISGDINDH